jgi:glycosyltransferase involved in cell wall biosynthesis
MITHRGITLAPKVSICIPTYNGRDHLKECLDSVRSQSFQDFEVVICDDQSSDGTLDFARELAQGDERFRFIPNPQRFGLVGNWNNCIALARGDWIKFVFQDDIIAPTCVERLLKACELTGTPFGFCAREFVFEDGTEESLRKFFHAHRAALDSFYLTKTAIEAVDVDPLALRNPSNNPVGEPTVTLIQKSVFERIGLFDDKLIQLCDTEFWYRVISNHGAAWVPERLATFRIHAKATTASNTGSRSYWTNYLDPLIVRYRFAFGPCFSKLRSQEMTGQSEVALRHDCAVAASRARRQLWWAALSAGKRRQSLAKEWNAVAACCPGVTSLARLGVAIAAYRYVKRAAGRLVTACKSAWRK